MEILITIIKFITNYLRKTFHQGDQMTVVLAPHKFATTVRIIDGMPKIEISRKAADDMAYIIDKSPKEVSWLGSVKMIGENPQSATYHIEEVFIIDQQVSAAETEMNEDGLGKFGEEMSKTEKGMLILNHLHFWGHSHVEMETFASATDIKQMDLFKDNDRDYFIRGIFNKKGKAQFSIFLYELDIEFHDVEWSVKAPTIPEARKVFWDKELEAKVHARTYNYNNIYARNYGITRWEAALDNVEQTQYARNRNILNENKNNTVIKFEDLDHNDERLRVKGGTGSISTVKSNVTTVKKNKATDNTDPEGGDILDGKHGDALLGAWSQTDPQGLAGEELGGGVSECHLGLSDEELNNISSARGRIE